MSLDPTRNFLKQTLATGYSLSATAITLPDASKFPNPATEGAFNLTWWNVTDYQDPADDPSKEIVRVTAISGNIATIIRGQEGTTATAKNLSGKNYQIALALTKKTMDDIDTTLETVTGDLSSLETRVDTAEGDITQIEGDLGVVEGDISALQSGKQDNLGFTPENVANKANTTLDTSTTKYPTNRLVKEAVDAKQNSLGFTPENVANKSTDVSTDSASDTKYPSVKAIKDYADSLVAGLLNYRGGYDASVNTFPTTGGSGTAGAIMKGDMFIISVAGTLGGTAVQVGDSLISSIDAPGQTAGNWNILNSNISYVPEDVANKATTVTGNEASDTKYGTIKAIYDWSTGLFATQSALSGYAPTSRTLTINGTTQDLSSNRTWTIAVPTKTSDLTNDSGFITSSALFGYLQNNVGISGGTTLVGGTASGNNLTLVSTSHATKGKILFGTSAYDEVNNRLGIRTTNPLVPLHIEGSNVYEAIRLRGDGVYMTFYENGNARTAYIQADDGNKYFNIALEHNLKYRLWVGGNEVHTVDLYGRHGLGVTSPTARLHLKAGTASANTAPIKLTAGTNLTTPEDGAFEFDGTNLYFTVGGVRKTVQLV